MRDTSSKFEEIRLALISGDDRQIDPDGRIVVLLAFHEQIWPDVAVNWKPCQRRLAAQIRDAVAAAHEVEPEICQATLSKGFLERIWPQ